MHRHTGQPWGTLLAGQAVVHLSPSAGHSKGWQLCPSQRWVEEQSESVWQESQPPPQSDLQVEVPDGAKRPLVPGLVAQACN